MNEYVYPIRKISEVTGVPSVTLRAWERRYGLLKPARTDKGHRLYSQQDIDTIKNVLVLIDKGVAVSNVKALLWPKAGNAQEQQLNDRWLFYCEKMILAIENFDQKRLEAIYNDVLSLYPIDIMTEKLLLPLLKLLGNRWELNYQGCIAEEHFFSCFMRNKVGARLHHLATHATGKKILAAGLPGLQHEFALMLFSIHLMNYGYEVIYLGVDVPVEDIFRSASKVGVIAVVIDGSIKDKTKKSLVAATEKSIAPVFWHNSSSDSQAMSNVYHLTHDFKKSYQIIEERLMLS